MAIPVAAGAARLLWTMTKGALRQTKRLSPYKSSTFVSGKGIKDKTGKFRKTKFMMIKNKGSKTMKTGQDLTAIGSGINRSLQAFGASAKTRSSALSGYNLAYKHARKHKKLYGSGVAGAAAWDFLPGKDNA